ncbi:hypothetical protein L1N85_13465 [Paenibacillus alkaliterrae]|uniref:hypothetical protein n=1 Tax=Paenibacillus alkaliterrae TaxID=320909 RepID=UPI001F2B71C0|nr:hypothetical protein [Paenibacillus alkaliterrae]MCF2939429.1 hypothetical protein [Paenibacillus alkaliterrae]
MKRMSVTGAFLILAICLIITGCATKPYGHYKDDQMIGLVGSLNERDQIIDFDISEWTKRDERGPGMDDWGASYEARVLPSTKIRNEAGEQLQWADLKLGQKVQINPSKTEEITDTPNELILIPMSEEEILGRMGLFAGGKGSYRTTIVYEKGVKQPYDAEYMEKEAPELFEGGLSFLEYNPNYVLDVKEALDIDKLPMFLVFDTEKLVLKTNKLEEVIAFKSSVEEEAR